MFGLVVTDGMKINYVLSFRFVKNELSGIEHNETYSISYRLILLFSFPFDFGMYPME
jgi:hypothetical protein